MATNELIRDDGERQHLERICKKKYKKSIEVKAIKTTLGLAVDHKANDICIFDTPDDILDVSINESKPKDDQEPKADEKVLSDFYGKPKKSKKKKHHKRKHRKEKSLDGAGDLLQKMPVDKVISMDTFLNNAYEAQNQTVHNDNDDDDDAGDNDVDDDEEIIQEFKWNSSFGQSKTSNNDSVDVAGATPSTSTSMKSSQMTLEELQEKYRYLDEFKIKRKRKKHKHLKVKEAAEERITLNDDQQRMDLMIPTAMMAQSDVE